MSVQFEVLYPGVKTEFEVHKVGCRDISPSRRPFLSDTYMISGTDVEDAIAAEVQVYTDQDQGWERSHFRVLPCCAKVSS